MQRHRDEIGATEPPADRIRGGSGDCGHVHGTRWRARQSRASRRPRPLLRLAVGAHIGAADARGRTFRRRADGRSRHGRRRQHRLGDVSAATRHPRPVHRRICALRRQPHQLLDRQQEQRRLQLRVRPALLDGVLTWSRRVSDRREPAAALVRRQLRPHPGHGLRSRSRRCRPQPVRVPPAECRATTSSASSRSPSRWTRAARLTTTTSRSASTRGTVGAGAVFPTATRISLLFRKNTTVTSPGSRPERGWWGIAEELSYQEYPGITDANRPPVRISAEVTEVTSGVTAPTLESTQTWSKAPRTSPSASATSARRRHAAPTPRRAA